MPKTLSAAIVLFAIGILPAAAQNARSFVSAHGSDSAACTLAAPCRTFAAAFAATNASGEIDVLDPAGYGALTINKAISIVNDGVGTAGVIVPSGGTGITINAGPNDAVSLRGLSIEGNGVGATGIIFNTGKSLTVENCVIRHMTSDGMAFNPAASNSLSISNSLVADNGFDGIRVQPTGTSSAVTAVFNRVEVNNNANDGIFLNGSNFTGTINATVSESIAASNGGVGFRSHTITGQITTLMVFHSSAVNNSQGLEASGTGAILRVRQSTVTGNASGWAASGVLQSYGDNSIDGNASNELAPPSVAMK